MAVAAASQDPWSVQTQGDLARITYESTTITMPLALATRFGLAVANACSDRSMAASSNQPTASGRTTATGRKPARKSGR
jgi:hypothetical protein